MEKIVKLTDREQELKTKLKGAIDKQDPVDNMKD
jgi:hypothetical protein